jgi:hypothetical protein
MEIVDCLKADTEKKTRENARFEPVSLKYKSRAIRCTNTDTGGLMLGSVKHGTEAKEHLQTLLIRNTILYVCSTNMVSQKHRVPFVSASWCDTYFSH